MFIAVMDLTIVNAALATVGRGAEPPGPAGLAGAFQFLASDAAEFVRVPEPTSLTWP